MAALTSPCSVRPDGGWYVLGATSSAYGGGGDIPLPLPDAIRRIVPGGI